MEAAEKRKNRGGSMKLSRAKLQEKNKEMLKAREAGTKARDERMRKAAREELKRLGRLKEVGKMGKSKSAPISLMGIMNRPHGATSKMGNNARGGDVDC
ncbi:hypothetical protein HDU76_005136 [Blyttiomyces sp. JEL0837]|nr:hypothetical protein HDU76_005136 [Blyttiomyces sp. JEL0837]